MSILALPHAAPKVLLFDWHGTLVDTHDAVYYAIDEVLRERRLRSRPQHLVHRRQHHRHGGREERGRDEHLLQRRGLGPALA